MTRLKSMAGAFALSLAVTAPSVADAQRYDGPRQEHRRDRGRDDRLGNTLLGAGLGLLGGALLSGGDPWATVAGAAAGGAIGNVATDDRRDRGRWDRRRDRNDRRVRRGDQSYQDEALPVPPVSPRPY